MSSEPEWLRVLRDVCKNKGQRFASRAIQYSVPTISAILKGNYTADTKGVQKAVEGGLMNEKVECPVLGDLTLNLCGEHQRRPYANTNPHRVQLYNACRNGCPHSRLGKAEGAKK